MNRVISGSMEPEIKKGSLVINICRDSYENGDVITYLNKRGKYVTHRIVMREKDAFLVKGDTNNIVDDCLVTREMIRGKVVFSIPILGTMLGLCSGVCGRLLLIVLLGVSIVLIYQEREKTSKEESDIKHEDK